MKTSPKNIAFLLDSSPGTWSSQEDRHLKLGQTLISRGCHPVLVFSRAVPPRIADPFIQAGIGVEVIDYGKGPYHYYQRLNEVVRTYSIGTAHIIFFDYFSPIPWLARMVGVRNVIYEMQNSGTPRAKSWKLAAVRLRTKLMAKPMTRVVAISEFVKQQLVAVGFNERKIAVRHLGVDTQRFVPNPGARREWAAKFDIRPEELILSTVSYLRPFKNAHIILQACAELVNRGVPFRLIVGGGGELLEELKHLSERLGISARTHWLGNWPDPVSLLQASDIFILSSVGEAFGLVLAEAMACGTPVVGSRSGAIPEVVEHERTGLLATPLDPISFADAIERLAKDPELLKAMGARGIERVRRRFSVDGLVEQTVRVYDSIWSKTPVARSLYNETCPK